MVFLCVGCGGLGGGLCVCVCVVCGMCVVGCVCVCVCVCVCMCFTGIKTRSKVFLCGPGCPKTCSVD